jgi:hypothetical protein
MNKGQQRLKIYVRRPSGECRFKDTLYDLDGNPLLQQTAEVHGAYPHGAVATLMVGFDAIRYANGTTWAPS